MSWLRVDDGFANHPKIGSLSDKEFRVWMRLLCWCARYKTDDVTAGAQGEVVGLTRSVLNKLTDGGLLELGDDGKRRVHDWHVYNPKDGGAAQRMERTRNASPRPTGDLWKKARAEVFARDGGVCADCGKDCSVPTDDGRDVWNADHEPHRAVLTEQGISIYDIASIITRCHSCHSKKTRSEANHDRTTTEPNSEPEANQSRNGSVASRERLRARSRPVPDPTKEETDSEEVDPRAVTNEETDAHDETNGPGFDFDNMLKAVDW